MLEYLKGNIDWIGPTIISIILAWFTYRLSKRIGNMQILIQKDQVNISLYNRRVSIFEIHYDLLKQIEARMDTIDSNINNDLILQAEKRNIESKYLFSAFIFSYNHQIIKHAKYINKIHYSIHTNKSYSYDLSTLREDIKLKLQKFPEAYRKYLELPTSYRI